MERWAPLAQRIAARNRRARLMTGSTLVCLKT
jgi:hypothetical protein